MKFGRFITFIPHSVMTGFVNALAIIIFMAQFPSFKGANWQMLLMIAGTLAIIYVLPRFTQAVPSPLVAIIVMTDHLHELASGSSDGWGYGQNHARSAIFSYSTISIYRWI